MVAIERQGRIDQEGKLWLDAPLPLREQAVRVLVLVPEPDEDEWLRNAAQSPSFAFLHETEEDIYSPTDGKPPGQ
jgi:hypothetical protein